MKKNKRLYKAIARLLVTFFVINWAMALFHNHDHENLTSSLFNHGHTHLSGHHKEISAQGNVQLLARCPRCVICDLLFILLFPIIIPAAFIGLAFFVGNIYPYDSLFVLTARLLHLTNKGPPLFYHLLSK